MSLSYSAPLYLFFDIVVPPFHDDEEDFEFAAAGAKNVDEDKEDDEDAPRACASDLSALADELFRGAGVLLPLKLPPRLQHPADYFSSSAATSPTAAHLLGRSSSSSWSPFASSRRQHRGFDPFAAALEKVRRDDGGAERGTAGPSGRRRRARSLSPVRGADDARPAATCLSCSRSRHAGASATAAAAKKASGRPRRRRDGGGKPYRRRPSLLVCFGF